MPCDAIPLGAPYALWRAIDVDAPPRTAFRWLCQLRAAPYSYDLVDNFGRRSPRRLRDGLGRLVLGARVMTIFAVAGYEDGRSITIRMASRVGRRIFGDLAGSYVVVPRGAHARIVVKVRLRGRPRRLGAWLDWLMFREQLRTLARLAARTPPDAPQLAERATPPRAGYA